MKYDDASWHSGGDFPADLPPEAGGTHTGMFLAWALLSGLAGAIHVEDFPDDVPTLKARSVTPGAFFLAACDGKFIDEDLNDEGNAFARDYFSFENGQYLADYEAVLGHGIPDEPGGLYYIADTWESFDILRPTLDHRLAEWRAKVG